MLPRQKHLLKKIIQEHIKTAQPVGSLKLSASGLSSATIRHEMMVLESEGYICQPHTSAGRVPTEQGYRFYVEHFVESGKIDKTIKQKFSVISRRERGEDKIKSLARLAAELAQETIILAFGPHRLYFTGLTHLFAKPEFCDQALVTSVSEVLDHCEEVMPRVIDLMQKQEILIGKENPFGAQCSFIAAPILKEGLFGLLGPMRMEYGRNLGIVELVKGLI